MLLEYLHKLPTYTPPITNIHAKRLATATTPQELVNLY